MHRLICGSVAAHSINNNLMIVNRIFQEGLASLLYYGKEKENPVTEWFSRWENNKERLLDSCKYILSHDVRSWSEITPCNKNDKPLVVYRFTGNVMTPITTLRT